MITSQALLDITHRHCADGQPLKFGSQNHGLLPTAATDETVLVDNLFNAMMTVSMSIFHARRRYFDLRL